MWFPPVATSPYISSAIRNGAVLWFLCERFMSTILQSVPVGQNVGIDFSGGIDTSAALQ